MISVTLCLKQFVLFTLNTDFKNSGHIHTSLLFMVFILRNVDNYFGTDRLLVLSFNSCSLQDIKDVVCYF